MTAALSNLTTGDTASVTTVTVTMPAASAGNIIGVLMEINAGSGTTMTAPDGTWTSMLRVSNDTTGVISQQLWCRTATGSEAATYDWTLSASSANISWQSFTITGQDATTYSDQTPSSNSGNNSTLELTATSITTNVADCLGVAIFGAGTGTYTPTQPTGWTTFGGGHVQRGWGIFTKTIATASAIGDVLSSLGTTNRYWTSMLWAIRPTGSTPAGQPTSTRTQNIPYSGTRIQRMGV